MEQNTANVSSLGNKKPSKYPNFVRNLEILRQNGFYAEKKYASDFEIKERATINALDLEDGGVKLTELLKKGVSFGTIYHAANYGVSTGMILELLDLSQKIQRDIESGENKIDVMFSGNARKGKWCATFVASRLKELKVRELLYNTRHSGWLYIGNGITMIASDLSSDAIKRIYPQRQYKYIFSHDRSFVDTPMKLAIDKMGKVLDSPDTPKKTNNNSYKKMSYKKKLQLVNMMVNKIQQDLTGKEEYPAPQ